MGSQKSKLQNEGYIIVEETEKYIIAKKNSETFFIKKIPNRKVHQMSPSSIEALKNINHSHLLELKAFERDECMSYIIVDYCHGGSLAERLRKECFISSDEPQILSWFVEIIMALKALHEKGHFHKDLTLKKVFLNQFEITRVGGFGITSESLGYNLNKPLHYLPPETLTSGIYKDKSDIWSAGCILYELCKKKPAFSADSPANLIPKILGGPCPSLPKGFSPELCELLSKMLEKNPEDRPTAGEILAQPFVKKCLIKKCETTLKELKTILNTLRTLADELEKVHTGTSIASLTGGVIGLVGGITSIVGLILTPFTLGASLIVTGVGVGVSAAGGIAAGASNITKMVKQTSQREAVDSIIREFDQKTKAVVTWLQEIFAGLQTIDHKSQHALRRVDFNDKNLEKIGGRAVKNVAVVTEAARLGRVLGIGKIAAQTCRVVRVAEVMTGVLAGMFVAADVFFIAMDAKEIHNIRQAKAATASDQPTLSFRPEKEEKSSPEENIKSEIMKFVRSIRKSADDLQKVLNELESVMSSIPEIDQDLEWCDI